MSKSDVTKQLIIEKTAPIFNTKGFAGTSLSDIMQTTGLSKGCIYGNFTNKDEIAISAFEYNHQLVNEHFSKRIAQVDYSIDRLLLYPDTYKNYYRYPYLLAGCPILNTATEADDTHPLLKKSAAQALEFWKTSLENQIKRGITRQEILPETNPTEIATIMISLIEGAFMQSKLSGNTQALKISMQFLENLILQLKS